MGRHSPGRDLHILSIVVQQGSMAKAASYLSMSQPAVSESVANLEASLGVRLLDRTSRGVEPTFYAHALLKRGNVVFGELMQAVEEIAFLADPKIGGVRVATGDTGAAGLLAPAIDALSRRYPDIVVRVSLASAEPLGYPELRKRRVDVVLARVSKAFSHSELNVEILFDDPPRVVVGAQSPWARRRKLVLADLVNERWALTSDLVIRNLVGEAFAAHRLEAPNEPVTASSMLLRSRLLATGRYLTVLPESVLRHNAKQWSLKDLPIDLAMKPMCVTLINVKGRTVSRVVRLFIKQVRSIARSTSTSWQRNLT